MSEQSLTSFGVLLRQFRVGLRMSVPQLAARAGLHPNAIRRIESGFTAIPQKDTRQRLAYALGLSPQQRELLETAIVSGPRSSTPAARSSIPFVGRTEELSAAAAHLRAPGVPLLLFTGEPGIGKSRLLERISADAVARGAPVMHGGCAPLTLQEPYAPLSSAFRSYVQRPYGHVRDRLTGCEWLALMLPELNEAPFALPRWNPPAGQERHLMFAAVQRFVTQIGGPRGVVLVLDDLQWAGEDALDLLTSLVSSLPPERLRVVGACRDSEMHSPSPFSRALTHWAQSELVHQVQIQPLKDHEAATLLDSILAASSVDLELRNEVIQRGEGVPFFVMSLGLGTRDGAIGGERDRIPWDLHQSISGRIAALSACSQEVVALTALMDEAAVPVLAAAMSDPDCDLVSALDEAVRARILQEGMNNSYRVDHEIIRDVAQSRLSAARRISMHRSIARAMEQTWEADAVQRAAGLARQYLKAHVPERALPYLVQAGDQADAVFAHYEAAAYYREAVQLARTVHDVRTEASASEKLGATQLMLADYRAALTSLHAAVRLYRAEGDVEAEARVDALVTRAYTVDGRPTDGLAYVDTALQRLDASVSPATRTALHAARAECLHKCARFSGSVAAAEEASRHARAAGSTRLLASAEVLRGLALLMLGQQIASAEVLQRAVPLVESEGDLATLTVALRELGWLYLSGGEFQRAMDCRERALAAAEKLRDPAKYAIELANLAFVHVVGGRWDIARRQTDRAVATIRELGTPISATYPLFVSGTLGLIEGTDWPTAVAELEEFSAAVVQAGDMAALWQAQWALAELDVFRGEAAKGLARFSAFSHLTDYRHDEGSPIPFLLRIVAHLEAEVGLLDQAEPKIQRAVQMAEVTHDLLHLVDAYRVRASIVQKRHDWEGAVADLERAIDLGVRTHYRYGEARAHDGLGQLCRIMGDRQRATEELRMALTLFDRLGATKNAERVKETLAGTSV